MTAAPTASVPRRNSLQPNKSQANLQRASPRIHRGLDGLNFLLADVRDGLGPYLAIYLLAVRGPEQGWNPATIGLVMTIAGIAGLLAQAPAGALIDRSRQGRMNSPRTPILFFIQLGSTDGIGLPQGPWRPLTSRATPPLQAQPKDAQKKEGFRGVPSPDLSPHRLLEDTPTFAQEFLPPALRPPQPPHRPGAKPCRTA
jgi:hypothetical protein